MRTRRSLHGSLIALLQERGWDAVSVQDICDRADVGRSTFYAHFADKEELLLIGFEEFRANLRMQLERPGGRSEPLHFVRGLIVHAYENRRLFRALAGKRTGQAVVQRFRTLILRLVADDLSAAHAPGPMREAAIGFIGGALIELLGRSVDERGVPQAAELERSFFTMAMGALRALRG